MVIPARRAHTNSGGLRHRFIAARGHGLATHSDWQTADGKHWLEESGEPLNFFDYKVKSALLSPLPDSRTLDSSEFRLHQESLSVGGSKFSCIMVVPLVPHGGKTETGTLGLYPTYCFDPKMPVLRISYSFGTVAVEFNKIVKTQNKYLPREIHMYQGKRKILSVEVDSITVLDPAEPSLVPSAEAKVTKKGTVDVPADVSEGGLIKKQAPIYPHDARAAHIEGNVVLLATIGTDGGVRDLRVVSTPGPTLSAAALDAVSHWQYKPFLRNGEPIEVETTVNVAFSLGR